MLRDEKSMTPVELKAYRIDLCRKVCNFEKSDRLPFVNFVTTWAFFNAGYHLLEAERDPEKMEHSEIKLQEDYNFDTAISIGDANAYKVDFPLGKTTFSFDEESDAVYIEDKEFMPHEDLPELAKDIKKYLYEKMLPSRYPIFNKEFDAQILQDSYDKIMKVFAVNGKISGRLTNEYGLAPFSKMMSPTNPIDAYVNWIRGIKGLAIDMRRDKEYMEDAVKAVADLMYTPGVNRIKASEYGPEAGFAFDGRGAMLMHNFMNVPQFEKYYWPYCKRTLDAFVERGKNVRLFTEGSIGRLTDFFADYPKGSICLSLDVDDVVEIRKALPNLPIMGGTRIETLGKGTPQECIDELKRCVDEAGLGFMVTQHKMVAYKNDATPENFKAISDWIHTTAL